MLSLRSIGTRLSLVVLLLKFSTQHSPQIIETMAPNAQPWQIQSAKAKDILQNSIPIPWVLPENKLPPAEQKNVLDFPRQNGVLTKKDLSITEMSAGALVGEMGAGKLGAEEVVVAFLKRAVIGQQLVCEYIYMDGCCIGHATDNVADAMYSSTSPRSSWLKGPLREPRNWTSIIDALGSWLGHW